MRLIAALVLALAVCLPAVEVDQVLAAARAASNTYQIRFRVLANGLEAADEATRLQAMRSLGELRDPNVVPLLMPFCTAPHSTAEMIMAATILGRLGYQTPIPLIRGMASHEDGEVRKAALSALKQIDALAAGDWMQRAKEDEESLRLYALAGLGHLKHAEAVEALVLGLTHENHLVRQAACIGLGLLGDRANGERIKISLTDANPMVRRYAAEALARLNYTPAIPDLMMALEANVAGPYILRAFVALTGDSFGFDPTAPLLMRQEAIERAFSWWSLHPELKQ